MSEKIEKEIVLENPMGEKYYISLYNNDDEDKFVIRNEKGEDFIARDVLDFKITMLSLGYRIYDIIGVMVHLNLDISLYDEICSMEGLIKELKQSLKN